MFAKPSGAAKVEEKPCKRLACPVCRPEKRARQLDHWATLLADAPFVARLIVDAEHWEAFRKGLGKRSGLRDVHYVSVPATGGRSVVYVAADLDTTWLSSQIDADALILSDDGKLLSMATGEVADMDGNGMPRWPIRFRRRYRYLLDHEITEDVRLLLAKDFDRAPVGEGRNVSSSRGWALESGQRPPIEPPDEDEPWERLPYKGPLLATMKKLGYSHRSLPSTNSQEWWELVCEARIVVPQNWPLPSQPRSEGA